MSSTITSRQPMKVIWKFDAALDARITPVGIVRHIAGVYIVAVTSNTPFSSEIANNGRCRLIAHLRQ